MEVYLDNSATTKPYEEVIDLMVENMISNYGNPSSLHSLGMFSEQSVKKARTQVARLLGVGEREIFFTSGGTEANNTAILGAAYARKKSGKKIITSAIEHPSVLEPLKRLEQEGFEVVKLGVDENGLVSIEELEKELTEDTVLISIMAVNNEIGTIQPIEKIAELKEKFNKKYGKKLIFHSDFVQALSKVQISTKDIDIITVSAHKIHGPKGVGAIYIRQGLSITPFLLGGGQEGGFRSGTENVPAIVGFGKAAETAANNMKARLDKILALRDRLFDGIVKNIEDIHINGIEPKTEGFDEYALPSILNVSFLKTRAEVLLHSLEKHEIYVSTGSACSSHKKQKSHVLLAIGSSDKEIESAIRFSFSDFNSEEEIDFTLEKLIEEVGKIRKLGSFR